MQGSALSLNPTMDRLNVALSKKERKGKRRKNYFINPLGGNYLHLQPGPCPPCWQPKSLPSFQSTAPLNGRWSHSSDNTVNQNSQNAHMRHIYPQEASVSLYQVKQFMKLTDLTMLTEHKNLHFCSHLKKKKKHHLVWVQRCHGSSTATCHFCLLLHSWAWLRDSTDFTQCTHNLHKGYNVQFLDFYRCLHSTLWSFWRLWYC